ncbi:hypothetical protein GCM10009104_23950 [Marinobacterium maritimum]|uniref:DUF4154 domain-containing protein n=1 Tax=Marinobacterium maritimum TaxID=500162 RepID=A0ABP3TAH1_9GAMM
MLCNRALADPQSEKISHIKAAFVYNIAKFVDWPAEVTASRSSHFVFCYYREDFLGRGFDSILGKQVQQRSVQKRVVEAIKDAPACDVMLIPESQLDRFQHERALSRLDPALTIADLTQPGTRESVHDKAIINLVRDGRGIGFEVNLNHAKQSGLAISSELLKLARAITP